MEINQENVKKVKAYFGPEMPESDILQALSQSGYNPDAAINFILSNAKPITIIRTSTATGARISTQIKQEVSEEPEGHLLPESKPKSQVKEDLCKGVKNKVSGKPRMSFNEFLKATDTEVTTTEEYLRTQKKEEVLEEKTKCQVKEEHCDGGIENKVSVMSRMSFDEFLIATNTKVMSTEECLRTQMKEELAKESKEAESLYGLNAKICSKEEQEFDMENKVPQNETVVRNAQVKQEASTVILKAKPLRELKATVKVKEEPGSRVEQVFAKEGKVGSQGNLPRLCEDHIKREALQKPTAAKKEKTEDRIVCYLPVEDGDFPEEPGWFLVGRTIVTALSTSKGRKLVDNEIVYFSFPSTIGKFNSIVRFSTKRFGEIGRLPMEWAKCIVPLVNSGKVKVIGRCVAAPAVIYMMQDIMLYVSFYIHHSIFTNADKYSWKLDVTNIDSMIYPLLTLFRLLKVKPFQNAEFTPEELDSQKRSLNLEGDQDDAASMLPIVKRRKGCQQYSEQDKDEQAVSESSLNRFVGAADIYNLEEMEPPSTLMCELRSYQKQALYWMSELEKGIDVEKAAKTLHPCWAAYRICDERASSIYVNLFSGEATTQFPTAIQMARGGILADAMGLGKTVMMIALILTRPGRNSPDNQEQDDAVNTEVTKKRKQDYNTEVPFKPKGGTLIVCPMALLSQWKDELETHSKPETISIMVYYGGERTNNPKVISEQDVVLTTYGVLTSAYKNEGENSIFHRVDWYRVVLDEAHTIKSSRTQGAQAAFALSSCCRWCLTGTPLQNNVEDLYSLLCFLHVEPWCNWAWWNKLIKRPFENGDPRGIRLIKAILRPLMLRRTKETKDKEGRPILVLPPADIQIIECEQSETEHDFYDALFKRSKVQFDQFVAQGKVLHNYANILELLLRLRQCCNHPFLVMSRCDTQKYADVEKLARKFLETNSDSAPSKEYVPSRAYVEEVVEGIRRGENTECPICLESADDPVLTPCAHRMCRECLLSSWRTPVAGPCPICRQVLSKNDLITCPSESRFRVDVEKNWKESSKILKLLDCLEQIRHLGSGEKSIVFSQWTAFLDLLEIPLKRRGIGFLRFDGKLVQKQREMVLKEFSETKEKMIMLMSLKAGGVGLNLTAASNVFLMDPWWNPAVEEQAIMRIHRIGQKRKVSVRRFVVKGTVEERMQQVQARKQRMIAGALTDEEVRSARIEELKMLFR